MEALPGGEVWGPWAASHAPSGAVVAPAGRHAYGAFSGARARLELLLRLATALTGAWGRG